METAFRDKTAIVTGAGHGFGRAIAHAFAVRGAWVFGCDINEEALAETAREAPAGDRLSVGRLDVTDRAAVRTYVDAAQARTGAVDILVNNAGGVLGLGPVHTNYANRVIIFGWRSRKPNTLALPRTFRCNAATSACRTCRCSTPSCTWRSMAANGAACPVASAIGTPFTCA